MLVITAQGLELLVLGSAFLAVLATVTDSADFAEGLSAKLLGTEDEEISKEQNRIKEVKVRNPVTGRWIRFGGPTYTKLIKQGILVEVCQP